MILGIPTLATKVGGFEDRIEEGRNGFLVEPEKNAVIDKLKMLSQQRELLSQIGTFLKSLSHRTLQEMVNDYHKVVKPNITPQNKPSIEYVEPIVLKMTQAEWERIQAQLARIDELQERIKAMESSKFWKMRKAWFKLKRLLNLPGEE